MNYSMNDRTYGRKVVRSRARNNHKKRLVMFWTICFLICIVLGFFVGYAVASANPSEQMESDASCYGTIDGRVFTQEMSLDWSGGAEVDFIPLGVPMDEDMQEFIHCLSYGYNIEFPFVMAVIETESQFDADVISGSNDYGLMQINSINHDQLTKVLGVTNYLDPYENVRAGIFMLRQLFEKYEDPSKVLMAYNLGEGGAKRLWENGVLETNYSRKIMKKAAEYEQQISERKGEIND